MAAWNILILGNTMGEKKKDTMTKTVQLHLES